MSDIDIGSAVISKIRLKEGAAPGTPASGYVYVYVKADGYFYAKDDAGTEQGPLALMTGDSGAGGTAGLVPAPGAGDAAANKYLKADATWTAVAAGVDAYEDGVSVVATADKFDFQDAFDVVDAGSNDASIYLKLHDFAGGRLTLETGVPVSTSDQTAATTLYYTPYIHDMISLFDGTRWIPYTFTERSVAIPTTTSTPSDVFLYDNSGTLTLSTTDWTNDTTRATALTTQNGRYVKSGATGYRYLGTIRTTAVEGECEDSRQYRLLWNASNRVVRPVGITEATNSWSYSTATWRSANASDSNRIGIVAGLSIETLPMTIMVLFVMGSSSTTRVGIAEDANNTVSMLVTNSGTAMASTTSGASLGLIAQGQWNPIPAIGYHYYQWVENSILAATTTFYSYSAAGSSARNSGILGTWTC